VLYYESFIKDWYKEWYSEINEKKSKKYEKKIKQLDLDFKKLIKLFNDNVN
jgi:hypothetical protein